MNEQIITRDGLINLSRVNSSCKVLEEKKIENLKYLIGKARGEEDIELKEFLQGLPQKSVMYQSIADFAVQLGTINIGRDAVWKFFGGSKHISDVVEQIKLYGLDTKNPEFSKQFLFSHVLLPVEITGIKEDEIDAVYRNADIAVPVKGLFPVINHLPAPGNHHLQIGDIVFSHQASIVHADPGSVIREALLDYQYSNTDFKEAARYLSQKDGIDYNKFWKLRQWTKKLVEEVSQTK